MDISHLERQSFKALKPKALNSIKALSIKIKDKLNDTTTNNDKFYYKAAWRLSEAQIFNILERAESARDPQRYFFSAAAAEMRQGGE